MRKQMKTHGWASVVIKNVAALLVSVFFIEISLHAISAVVPKVDELTRPQSALIDDDRLILRGNPNWPDHDARGFRNPTALSAASVVALGDSHTYGTNVAVQEAWPSILSKLLGEQVYNMGLPGYASSQALETMPTAIALDPEAIVFALYFGNDFCEEFMFVRKNKLIANYASSSKVDEINELERQGTIEDEVAFLFGAGRGKGRMNRLAAAKIFVKENVRIYGLFSAVSKMLIRDTRDNALLRKDFDKAVENLSDKQLEYVSIFDAPDWKTIFTSRYRLLCLEDSDPRVRMGLNVSMRNIEKMHRMATDSGIKFYVVLVPTKESAFYPRVKKPDEHKLFTHLNRSEEGIKGELENYMQERSIAFIDPAPELRLADSQPYFQNGDGHPNAIGHKVIAKSVYDAISAEQY